ncbi:hypothetical protein [Martelella endophytica]|uniref:Uncharacterized protein n=1 Tax=Martelella endophytica TaxID=1486262 RepID=A0A0D5LRW1_MAREN|nr:hypothetical protein [Martelella endophytica]AJY46507.1 hypothetical protein TM49_13785 [Martelella endophytica]
MSPSLGFRFDADAYRYSKSVDILKDTLSAALRGLRDQRATLQEEYNQYEEGGVRIGEWEDDGVKLWDQADVYAFQIDATDEAIANLYKPYVIAFYHNWERNLARRANLKDKPNHTVLRDALSKMGVTLPDRLDAVRDLTNALKHNSDYFGRKLLKSWEELLPMNFSPRKEENLTDWYELINISGNQMLEIIATVRKAYPDVST